MGKANSVEVPHNIDLLVRLNYELGLLDCAPPFLRFIPGWAKQG